MNIGANFGVGVSLVYDNRGTASEGVQYGPHIGGWSLNIEI